MDLDIDQPDNFPDLSDDMSVDSIIVEYLGDREIAVLFYSALCNMRWKKRKILPNDELLIETLKGTSNDIWSCSWRAAGGIIADIRNANYNGQEDYMDFYCSGNEGYVSDLVNECFERIGWTQHPWELDDGL